MGISYKNVLFGSDALKKLKNGVNKLAEAVVCTLGPKGRTVIIDNELSNVIVTKDGVTVAKEFVLKDKEENTGVKIAKQSATETAKTAGDGTTTTIALLQDILEKGSKYVESGSNPVDLNRGMQVAKEKVIEYLNSIKKEILTQEEITNVATISANSDKEIGKHIADAINKIGKDGVITVEESKSGVTTVDIVDGMKYDKGYISPYLVTDTTKMKFEVENPMILVVNKNVTHPNEIIGFLECVGRQQKPFILIANDVTGVTPEILIVNHLKGIMKACAVKAPSFGDKQKEIMEDIAIAIGGICITDEKLALKNISIDEIGGRDPSGKLNYKSPHTQKTIKADAMDYIGTCDKIVIDHNSFTIMNGHAKTVKETVAGVETDVKRELLDRIAKIKNNIEITKDDEQAKQYFQNRLAKLTNGIAVIKVGAPTEAEMKEKKDRVDDAVSATKAAIEEGIVVGGGVALVRASQNLEANIDSYSFENEDQKLGYKIICQAITNPLRIIVKNAGQSEQVVLNEVRNQKNKDFGYNAQTEKYVNLLEAGIIDPVKVTKTALENAISSASMLLTTQCILEEEMDEKIKQQMLDPSNGQY